MLKPMTAEETAERWGRMQANEPAGPRVHRVQGHHKVVGREIPSDQWDQFRAHHSAPKSEDAKVMREQNRTIADDRPYAWFNDKKVFSVTPEQLESWHKKWDDWFEKYGKFWTDEQRESFQKERARMTALLPPVTETPPRVISPGYESEWRDMWQVMMSDYDANLTWEQFCAAIPHGHIPSPAAKDSLREALLEIRAITGDTHRERPYTALSEIDQIARKALA